MTPFNVLDRHVCIVTVFDQSNLPLHQHGASICSWGFDCDFWPGGVPHFIVRTGPLTLALSLCHGLDIFLLKRLRKQSCRRSLRCMSSFCSPRFSSLTENTENEQLFYPIGLLQNTVIRCSKENTFYSYSRNNSSAPMLFFFFSLGRGERGGAKFAPLTISPRVTTSVL